MTPEQIREFYRTGQDESGRAVCFCDMTPEQKLNPSKKLSGILKLSSLLRDRKNIVFGAGYGEILFFVGTNDLIESVTEDDLLYLTGCGVYYSLDDNLFFSDI